MYERLMITFVVMAVFWTVVLLLKRRQMTLAKRASEQLKKSAGTPTIVYFWANGCPVCKRAQRPIIERILAEYGRGRVAFTAYNIDEAPDVAKEWGVMTLPTTIVLDAAGVIKYVNNGLIAPENLRKQLEPMLSHSA